jgi:hypothetical protein
MNYVGSSGMRLLICLLLSALILAIAQTRIGPISGMRMPIWDLTQPGTNKYIYVRPNSTQFTVAKASDGIPELSILAVPQLAFTLPTRPGTVGETGTCDLIAFRRLAEDMRPGPCVDSHGAAYAENSVILGTTGVFLCSSGWTKLATLARSW